MLECFLIILLINFISFILSEEDYPLDNFDFDKRVKDAFSIGGYNIESLKKEFIETCRIVRSNSSFSHCYGHDTKGFQVFLNGLKSLHKDISGIDPKSFDKLSWDAHCSSQEKLKDGRTQSICQALYYLILPFPFYNHNHSLKKSIQDESNLDLNVKENKDKSNNYKNPLEEITTSTSELKLKLVTVISDYKWNTALSVQSSCLFDTPITVLGVGIKNMFKKGLAKKIYLLRSYLDHIPEHELDNSVVLFVDGTDTMIQTNEKVILEKFIKLGHRMVFSGEHSCFPMKYFPWNFNVYGSSSSSSSSSSNSSSRIGKTGLKKIIKGDKWKPCGAGSCSNSRYICDTLFPKGPDNDPANRWLNSGAFIGYARDLRDAIKTIVEDLPNDVLSLWPGGDQGMYSHLYLSRRYDIHIDTNASLFLSFGLVRNEDEWSKGMTTKNILEKNRNFNEVDEELGNWFRARTYQHFPAIFHFNAGK